MMTVDELRSSAQAAKSGQTPPSGLSPEVEALWHCKAGNWEASHDIAQDIPSAMGSWIHALLHLIEGDIGNAGYWFSRAGKSPRKPGEIDDEWERIASELLA